MAHYYYSDYKGKTKDSFKKLFYFLSIVNSYTFD